MNINFKGLVFYTLVAVFFLILVGGIVRSLGAGMGCPDWPRCYGKLIPPTSSAALPENYEQQFVESRLLKNNRLANMLASLGFEELSEKVSNDPSIEKYEQFDPLKAWVEYINRLIGVIIGLLITLVGILSIFHWNKDKVITILGLSSFVLVVFQGWVGSIVVSTNLLTGFISFHMSLALLLVLLLIIIHEKLTFTSNEISSLLHESRYRLVLVFILFLLQIWMGIQVREEVDFGLHQGVEKANIINNFSSIFFSHRTFSLFFLVFFGIILNKSLSRFGYKLHVISLFFILLFVEIVFGAVLFYFDLPFIVQPFHLLVGSLLFALLFKMNLMAFRHKAYV